MYRPAPGPDPVAAIALAGEMLSALGTRNSAIMSLEGYSNAEIAAAIGRMSP
jgi:hypothetical protein